MTKPIQAAIVGAGGKTSVLLRLGRQLNGPVILTTTTHLAQDQTGQVDQHVFIQSNADLEKFLQSIPETVSLLTGPATPDGRVSGLSADILERLHKVCLIQVISLLVEADGSRRLPLKAPAAHEPAIPPWVSTVIVVAGMSGVGQILGPESVHRPERFSELTQAAASRAGPNPPAPFPSGKGPGVRSDSIQSHKIDRNLSESGEISIGDPITPRAITRVLAHPEGGLKNIPPHARRIALLNQADTDELQSQAGRMARDLLGAFPTVLVGSLRNEGLQEITACFQPVAGVILAAGGAVRYGQPKPLLEWRGQPFIYQVARTALEAGLDPVIVVTGSAAQAVGDAVAGLPVQIVNNPDWQAGQSSSVRAGINSLPDSTAGAIFLLADQPQITAAVLSAELELYWRSLGPIIAPLIDGKRANPVLFDRQAFEALKSIQGDAGGRQVFSQFTVTWLEWNDRRLLLDVDTPEDYQRLLELQ